MACQSREVNNLDEETAFIGGLFIDCDIPKEKQYLLKYFRSDLQQQFVRYMLQFGTTVRFVDHTGYYCSERWLKVLKAKMIKLEATYDKAKKDFDFETVAQIEMGKYHVGSRRKRVLAKRRSNQEFQAD